MFFVFPLNDKPDWRNPPWMTIALILVNVLVYFGPQGWDRSAEERAAEHYLASPLPKIELPRYSEYLRARGDRESVEMARRIDAAVKAGHYAGPYSVMSHDRRFRDRLETGRIIRPDEPGHAEWQQHHRKYQSIRGTPFTENWASNPAVRDPATLFTAMFLHGGLAHLLGNMVFLFVFGYTVEKTLGSTRYLAFYVIAGLGGSLADLIVRWGSPIATVGASGAISGLMAMYVMLYGMQRIRFFYQFLFYFDYVTAPAIILLPAWIAHELLQQWLGGQGVAYMAHAGGLITGALLVAWQKRRHPETKAPPAEAPPDPHVEEIARAEGLLKQLRVDEARAAFAQLVKSRPNDLRLVSQYFNLSKLKPSSEDFHRAAAAVFSLSDADPAATGLVYESFRTYMQSAKPGPQLAPAILARLALRFGREGHAADSGRLAKLLLARSPDNPEAPRVLLAAINALRRAGDAAPANDLVRELNQRFPQSAEARLLAQAQRA